MIVNVVAPVIVLEGLKVIVAVGVAPVSKPFGSDAIYEVVLVPVIVALITMLRIMPLSETPVPVPVTVKLPKLSDVAGSPINTPEAGT